MARGPRYNVHDAGQGLESDFERTIDKIGVVERVKEKKGRKRKEQYWSTMRPRGGGGGFSKKT
jgi:hypothetical protein